METSESKFLDPERLAIGHHEIPGAEPPRVSKGYWDAVVKSLDLLDGDQVWKIPFPPDTQVEGMRSSIHWAGARAGRKLGVLTRGSCVYVWDTHIERERKRYRPPREPFTCPACGDLIENPRFKQVAHGAGKRKSNCQKALLYAKRHGTSPREEWLRISNTEERG